MKVVEEIIINKSNTDIDINEIVKEAYKIIIKEDMEKAKEINRISVNSIKNVNDLRFVIKEGKKNNLTTYESLKEKGYIRKFEENSLKEVM